MLFTKMRTCLLLLTLHLIFIIFPWCEGFVPTTTMTTTTTTTTLLSSSALPNDNNHAVKHSSSGPNIDGTLPKITYRRATVRDIPEITGLLISSFEEKEEDAILPETTTINNNKSENVESNKIYMWDNLATSKKQNKLSLEQEHQFIESQLAHRMVEVQGRKKESLPHSFLVATMSSSVDVDDTNTETSSDPQKHQLVGFLEMGTLPSPIFIPIDGIQARPELPYLANVAVDASTRRRKIGSTLVQLATKIAAKWCCIPSSSLRVPATSTSTSFPPFLFLSVERDNENALLFYERLGFEELNISTTTTRNTSTKSKLSQKIYLARGLD